MPNPGDIGNIFPPRDDDAWRAIRDLQQQVRELQTAKIGNAMTVDGAPGITIKGGGGLAVQGGGDITVAGGGSIEVDDGGGINVNDGGGVKIDDGGKVEVDGGYIVAYAADGVTPIVVMGSSPITAGLKGFEVWRADGSIAILADSSGSGGFVGIYDHSGNVVLSDDATSGKGLATPHLCGPSLQDTNILNWPSTASGSFTTIAQCFMERQNPRIRWTMEITAYSTGVTGEFKLLVNGVQVGTTQSTTFSTTFWSDVDDWPVGTLMFNDYLVELQARVSAGGPGTAAGLGLRLRGDQS